MIRVATTAAIQRTRPPKEIRIQAPACIGGAQVDALPSITVISPFALLQPNI